MLSAYSTASLGLAALLLCNPASAAPHANEAGFLNVPRLNSRDDSSSNSTTNSTKASLEPIVPPTVNQNDISILSLATNVTLAWAGSPTNSTAGSSPQLRMLKRDGGIFSQALMTFAYPTIPLDHSSFVSGVSCSNGSLTATLSDNAYSFAQKQWTGATDIVFVTSVDGCGLDNQNDFFHAKSISFSDSNLSFTAIGSSAALKTVAQHVNLKWGDIGSLQVKRAIDKRDMFEPHSLSKRDTESVTLSWDYWLNDDDHLGTDPDAPWPNAAPLEQWGKEGGEEDDSYEKGEVASPTGHHKRSNETSLSAPALATRDLDYGLALYCVECGFGGSATIWGEMDASLWTFSIDTLQVGFNANFEAGLNLGMEAFVKYEQEWSKELGRIDLGGFEIPLLVDVGPFISVSVDAEVTIDATGTLLIGASVSWDNIDIMLDLLDSSNSHANGLSPSFQHTAEASGELHLEASLGLPIKLGVGLSLFDGLYEADAAIVDTPSIVAEGSFVVSASVGDDGEIEVDLDGSCYGIAWDIHFENTLQAVLEGDDIGSATFNLIDPQESAPIAQGCIGYVNDGTDDNDSSNPQGKGDSTGMGGNGLNSGGSGLAGSGSGSGSG
ncbi:hypothetical protein ACHAQJ_010402, partial [Trichoderma viride]